MRVCTRCGRLVEGERCPFCGTGGGRAAADPTMARDDLIGRTFGGRYLVTSLIGHGAQASVYRARDQRSEHPIALKVFSREVAGDVARSDALVRAALSWSTLRHSHTATVLDVGSADGRPYVAVEAAEGRTLRVELRSAGRFPEARLLRIAEQVCESLVDAHDRGVVHMDLKPENVFLSRTPGDPDFVKVLDYGLARWSEGLTEGTPLRGTPTYIAPERIQGGPGDSRSDLYSLGVMLYEMASGLPPFQADTPVELLLMHLHNRPLCLTAAWPDTVSSGFDSLVMSLLARSPDHRPRDAAAALASIRELAAHGAVGPVPVRGTIRLPALDAGRRRTREAAAAEPPEPPPLPPLPEPQPQPSQVATAAPVEPATSLAPPPAVEPVPSPATPGDGGPPAEPLPAADGAAGTDPATPPAEPSRRITAEMAAAREPDSSGSPAPVERPGVETSRPAPHALSGMATARISPHAPAPAAVTALRRAAPPGGRRTATPSPPIRVRDSAPRGRPAPVPLRKQVGFAAIAFASGALVLLATVFGWWGGTGDTREEPAPAPVVAPPPRPAPPAIPAAVAVVRVDVSPPGARLAQVRAGSELDLGSGPTDIVVREGETIYLRASAPGFRDEVVSIDYQSVADSRRVAVTLSEQ